MAGDLIYSLTTMIWLDSRARQIQALFVLIMVLGLLIRIWAAVISHGFVHPDEHYQVLEPAHGLVYGYWEASWEWARGIRSYFLPSLFASWIDFYRGIFKTEDPLKVIFFLRMICAFLSLITLYAVYRVGRILETDRNQGWVSLPSVFICAVCTVFVYYSVRTLSEPIAMNVIALSIMVYFINSLGLRRNPWRDLGIGILVGIAFSIRFQSGIFGISFAILYLLKKEWKSLVFFLIGSFFVLMLQGFFDLYMGYGFLGTPIEYFKFNIIESGASQWSVAPWHRYITALNRFFTFPLAVWLLIGAMLSLSRNIWIKSRELWILILPFWLIHNFIGHKEDRFIIPILPWIVVLAVYGWIHWMRNHPMKGRSWVAVSFFGAIIVSVLYGYSQHSWAYHGDYTVLMAKLGQKVKLKGLAIVGTKHSGSYFYLHQDVPIEHFSSLKEIESKGFDSKVPDVYPSIILFQNKDIVLKRLAKHGVKCKSYDQLSLAFHCWRTKKGMTNG